MTDVLIDTDVVSVPLKHRAPDWVERQIVYPSFDGRIGSNPAQHVRRPQVHPSKRGIVWPAADHPGSDRRRLYPFDRVHPVDGPVKGSDLADPGALGARDEVCLGEVDAVGLVHLDSPE